MNYRWLTFISMIILSTLLFSESFPQRMKHFEGRGLWNLNLSEVQKDQIEDLRIDHRKEIIKLRSDLEMKELELRQLENSENVSRNDYISLVKELSAIKNRIAEARANHRLDVYEILDDNQKKDFFSRRERFGRGFHERFRGRDF